MSCFTFTSKGEAVKKGKRGRKGDTGATGPPGLDAPCPSRWWRTGIQLLADTDLAEVNHDRYNRNHSKGEQYNQLQYEQCKLTNDYSGN